MMAKSMGRPGTRGNHNIEARRQQAHELAQQLAEQGLDKNSIVRQVVSAYGLSAIKGIDFEAPAQKEAAC